jgi:DNA-binding MarR family transcriptional regulator
LVKRVASKNDRRSNHIFLTKEGKTLEQKTMEVANRTLNEALEGVTNTQIEMAKKVLQTVYDNLAKK